MIYRERTEVVITLKEDADTDEALALVETAGLEQCEVNRTLRMIIGYVATIDISDRRSVYQHLREIPAVQDVSSAVIHSALRENS